MANFSKFLFLASPFLLATTAYADVIKCSFTEPFFDTTYDTSKETLKVNALESSDKRTYRKVSFQIKGAGEFELWDKDQKVLMKLTLNNKGSDGMSDKVYPYEGLFVPKESSSNHGIGGCWSTHLPATEEGSY